MPRRFAIAAGLCRGPVAPPLAVRQHGVGVGMLLEDEPAVLPALSAPTELRTPSSRRFSALATARTHRYVGSADAASFAAAGRSRYGTPW